MHLKRNFSLLAVAFLLTVMASYANAQDVIKIGALWPQSGPIAEDGQESLRGARIAAEMQNDQGGLWGKKIELVTGDASDPKAAMTEAERLITVEKTNIIMGTWVSGFAFTASQVAEKYKKIYWETRSTIRQHHGEKFQLPLSHERTREPIRGVERRFCGNGAF
jgi:branched-chain amino acid transport system substrate-binding protein